MVLLIVSWDVFVVLRTSWLFLEPLWRDSLLRGITSSWELFLSHKAVWVLFLFWEIRLKCGISSFLLNNRMEPCPEGVMEARLFTTLKFDWSVLGLVLLILMWRRPQFRFKTFHLESFSRPAPCFKVVSWVFWVLTLQLDRRRGSRMWSPSELGFGPHIVRIRRLFSVSEISSYSRRRHLVLLHRLLLVVVVVLLAILVRNLMEVASLVFVEVGSVGSTRLLIHRKRLVQRRWRAFAKVVVFLESGVGCGSGFEVWRSHRRWVMVTLNRHWIDSWQSLRPLLKPFVFIIT